MLRKLVIVAALIVTSSGAVAAEGHTNQLIMRRKHVPTVRFDRLAQPCHPMARPGSKRHACHPFKRRTVR